MATGSDPVRLVVPEGQSVPPIQRVRALSDIDAIRYTDGLAAVEVDADLTETLPIKRWERGDGSRLAGLMETIRQRGWIPSDPVICRIGRRGRWIVVDGGHRLTAVMRLRRSWWARLFGPKIRTLYFLLFLDGQSWLKVKSQAERIRLGAPVPLSPLPEGPDAHDD